MDDLIVFSVFEITRHLRQVVETQIEALYVRGEISNYTRHSSGHIYFNLTDPNATLRCTFFKPANFGLTFEPEEGMEVICHGKLTVYEKGGSYNLNVKNMELAGKGDLARQFELLKQKLQEEGLFASKHKQELPRFPKRIGIVTSPTGAALQDILNILRRRWPVEVLVYPSLVQGDEAPRQLAEGIQYLDRSEEVDLIILTRGGGSQEDLFCFNDEALARSIFAARTPIISAVGHEIDFSIADFVADVRAPTPSAAAELAVPDKKDILGYLNSLGTHLRTFGQGRLEYAKRLLGNLALNLEREHPERAWQSMQQRVDSAALDLVRSSSRFQAGLRQAQTRMNQAQSSMQNRMDQAVTDFGRHLETLAQKIDLASAERLRDSQIRLEKADLKLRALSPFKVLDRGFSLITRGEQIITSAQDLKAGDKLNLRLKDGSADARVENVTITKGSDA